MLWQYQRWKERILINCSWIWIFIKSHSSSLRVFMPIRVRSACQCILVEWLIEFSNCWTIHLTWFFSLHIFIHTSPCSSSWFCSYGKETLPILLTLWWFDFIFPYLEQLVEQPGDLRQHDDHLTPLNVLSWQSFGVFLLLVWIRGHDDVIKWKHIPRYWPFVWGIHRSPVNSPHKGQWRGALMFSLICV